MDPARLDDIARRHGVRLMVVFGSTVSGQVHSKSDVDIGVLLERPTPSFQEHAELLHDIQGLFPGREVDLAIINRADPLFLKQVMERCNLLYGALRELHELRCYAFRRHQDHRKYLALERDYVSRIARPPPAA
jgi:predicted nucleotidyltransferase